VIHADLPAFRERREVEGTDEGLVIQGERRREPNSEEEAASLGKSIWRFYRLIPLPESAKIEETKANFRNGVLGK